MKKIYIFLIAYIFTIFATYAQITITQSDMPIINMTTTEATDTFNLNVSVGNAGTNQTWDLSNIANQIQSISYWVNPATLPGAACFPTATIAYTTAGNQDTYVKISSTSVESLGFQGDNGSGVGNECGIFNPSSKVLQFPTNYLTTFSGSYTFDIKMELINPPIDSIKVNFASNYTSLIDGWGNVTTPAFSNVPSLRQKNTTISNITYYAHNTITGTWTLAGPVENESTISYVWFSNLKKFSIADIRTDLSGNVLESKYLLSTGTVDVNENKQIKNEIAIFPNPAKDLLTVINPSQTSFILIFDTNGKLMSHKMLKNNKNTINLSDYNNGFYFYHIVDINGQSIGKGKFSVIK